MRLSILFTAIALSGCNRSDADKPIEIGQIFAERDEDSIRALDLAVEEVNADPAKLPLGRRLVVRHAPAGNKPQEAGAQATRLIALNKVRFLVGGDNADQASRIGEALTGDSALCISTSDWPGISPAPNLFTVGIAPSERGRALAKIVLEKKPATVVIVRDRAAQSANLAADQFGAECKSAGVRVIDAEISPTRPTAEVVFFACSARQALATRHVEEKVCVFGGNDIDALLNAGASGDGFLIASVIHPVGDDFELRFLEKYGKSPTISAALTHDAVVVWHTAIQRANSLEPGPLREHLLSNNPFELGAGTLVFAADHTARRNVSVGRVADGKLKDIKKMNPVPVNSP
ncbi:MAG TPA: ABC transporter substrate-binding protein [Gemmataceae bacterium]|jgi:ABC-type branched-subunit amino acid transport system substrate-binding protein|nr:ABC transporter substrate-binding protein [Gemmataceae bacterium]